MQNEIIDYSDYDYYNKLAVPHFPLNYTAATNTITLRKAEIKVWKSRLLRHLAIPQLASRHVIVSGICGLLNSSLLRSTELPDTTVRSISRLLRASLHASYPTWPHFSGRYDYPIFDPEHYTNPERQYYHYSGSRWRGNERKARIALLNHWISTLPTEQTFQLNVITGD